MGVGCLVCLLDHARAAWMHSLVPGIRRPSSDLRPHSVPSCPVRRCIFDTDNIDIGPERRNYLDHSLSRVWEYNDEVRHRGARGRGGWRSPL